jgi:hypothetical protein
VTRSSLGYDADLLAAGLPCHDVCDAPVPFSSVAPAR